MTTRDAPLHVIGRRVVHQDLFTYELALWNNGTIIADVICTETLKPMQSASICDSADWYEELAKDDCGTWIEKIIEAAKNKPLTRSTDK